MIRKFEYTTASVADLNVESAIDEKSGKRVASAILVNDEPIQPTERFWNSFFARWGFGRSVFKYFDFQEVFRRIAQNEKQDRMRLCIERDAESGESKLLAVSSPSKPVVQYDELMDTLTRYEGQHIQYADGIVESIHVPRAGANSFQISGDEFENRFLLQTPIDGYGLPNTFLSVLRQVCANGMIGYAKTFRSSLALGRGDDDVTFSIVRALDGFGGASDEGYAALRQRFESATQSWASVAESFSLYRLLLKMIHRRQIRGAMGDTGLGAHKVSELTLTERSDAPEEFGDSLISTFRDMTGRVEELYGLANPDSLSIKRQRTLPVKATVYDLLNFTSEVATHHADTGGAREAQAWLGTLVSGEYDLEGTRESHFESFQEMFLEQSTTPGQLVA